MKSTTLSHQQGYTLIEVMVGATLGLFIIAGALNVFLSASKTNTLHSSISDLQEKARFVSVYLNNELERGGWLDPTTEGDSPTAITFGTTGTGEDVTVCNAAESSSLMCDRIQITYNGVRDCLGAAVNSGNVGVVTNTYYVENGELRCQGTVGTANDIILSDVESLQVLYGLDDSNGQKTPYTSTAQMKDGIIDRYVEAYDFNATGLSTLMSVRFSILLRGSEVNAYDQNTAQSYTLFNEATLNHDDRRMRLLVNGTAIVANGD
ncbi:MAG: PilW family protein [Pseudomonadales bacterium]|nr:PilW family protein [Pseudomonadales bacterium]